MAELWGPDTLFVVSTDFTHYGRGFGYLPFPVSEAPGRLRALDMGAIERILAVDLDGFWQYVERTDATICGRLAVAGLLAVLEQLGDGRCELVHYTNIGEMHGDYSHSVSYATLAVYATG